MFTKALTNLFAAAFIAAALSTLTAPSAYAGPAAISAQDKNPIVEVPTECNPRWYLSLGGGTDLDLGNDFSDGIDEFNDFGIITTELHVKSRNYDDVYKNWYNINAEIGYAITRHLDIFAKFTYTQADGQIITGSKLLVDSPINPFPGLALGFPFTSHFDNYSSYGGELGLRYYFTSPNARIRPYISLSGGAAFVDAIDLQVKSDFLNIDFEVYNGPFYDDTVTWTGTATLGVEYQVIPCRFSVGAEWGLRYRSGLDDNDSQFDDEDSDAAVALRQFAHDRLQMNGSSGDFASAFLAPLAHLNNNGGERWSLPLSVYAKFRF